MTKRNKFYQIGFFTLAIAFIALCLFVGITAIQKQMKLNLAVKMNPSIVCEIYASMDGANGTYNKIFSNVEGSTSIGTNWSISGNTLSYNTSSTDMGKEIYLKVTNKTTGTRVMVEYNNEVKDVIEVNGESETPFSVSIPGNGKVQMLFSQVFKVTTTLTNASVTATTNLYEIGGTYYAKTGTTPTMTLTSDTHYTNPPSSVEVTGATKGYTNGVLTLSNITGDVVVSASPIAMTYTVSSSLSGISSNTIANKATYNTDYTFTLTVASTSLTMGSVTYTVGGGSAQTLTGTTTDNLTYTYTIPGNKITGAIVINATATSPYAISYTLYDATNDNNNPTTYTPSNSEQKVINLTNPTYSGYTMLGFALGSAPSGVTLSNGGKTLTIPAGVAGDINLIARGYKTSAYTSDSVWYGYSYLTFLNNKNTNWIILGSGNSSFFNATNINSKSVSGSSFSTNGTQNSFQYTYTRTSKTFTVSILSPTSNPKVNGQQELSSNQVLLLKEKLISSTKYFDESSQDGYDGTPNAKWSQSTINYYLNNTYYTTDGNLDEYADYIEKKAIKTSWYDGANQLNDEFLTSGSTYTNTLTSASYTCANNGIFLMGSRYGYYENKSYTEGTVYTTYSSVYNQQNFCLEDYLGTWAYYMTESNPRMFTWSSDGTASSLWWLRSGYYNFNIRAYPVYSVGYFSSARVNDSSYGVRPSFVFNLA